VELRNYFPETWLFDLVELDNEGKKEMSVQIPDTITTWVADAVCLSSTKGAVVSDSANLLVSQDFFADLVLPYSVKRGEIFPLNVSVFNNVEVQLPIQLTIQNSDDFKIGNPVHNVCLPAGDNQLHSYTVKAKELNQVNVTVEAKIVSNEDCQSGDSGSEGYRDALVKPVIVKPEGFPLEETQGEFVCKQTGEEPSEIILKDLELPEGDNLVNGSARAWIAVTGDIMAPALANLDKLVTTPYGCGEQNMISVVPNIYLLEYLQGKGVSVPKIERRAKANIIKGWNRQQKYRHSNGGYSVWGPSDNEETEASMWLTSFVVKSFAKASKFVDIPENTMKQSIKFLMKNKDRETGCFNLLGYAIHSELKGPSLTLSVLMALLSQEFDPATPSKNIFNPLDATHDLPKSLRCAENKVLRNSTANDIYSKALLARVLFLNAKIEEEASDILPSPAVDETRGKAVQLMEELMPLGNSSQPGKLFWSTGKDNKARDVELTAYMVLNLVSQNKLSEALKAIKWLTTHRNRRGGFVSTQDTMVALEAISEYSKAVTEDEVDLKVEAVVESSGDDSEDGQEAWSETFDITKDNQLLFDKTKIPVSGRSTQVKLAVSGTGCAMIQSVLRYNVHKSPYDPVFELSAKTDGDVLKICAAYNGGRDATDMVVIEAELLSGYMPVESSLEKLVKDSVKPGVVPVKKYEYDEKENTVVMYFNDMPKEKSCWTFQTKRDNAVGDLQPANVKIYDYYDPKETFSTSYNLSKKNKEPTTPLPLPDEE